VQDFIVKISALGLVSRYHMSKPEVLDLAQGIFRGFKTPPDAFSPTPDGFTMRVDSHLFTSVAFEAPSRVKTVCPR